MSNAICAFCNETRGKHNSEGLCPVNGVTSQYFTSKFQAMMSDELRQATELLEFWFNMEADNETARDEEDRDPEYTKVIKAALTVSKFMRKHLAEHPADDDEPIDEAFLRSIDWNYHAALRQWASSWIGNIRIVYWPGYKQSEWWIDVRDPTFPPARHQSAVMAEISSIKTREDVRKLLEALGASR